MSQSKIACVINVGVVRNLANLPVKKTESLCQFCPGSVRTIASTIKQNRFDDDDDHKEPFGILNEPQSASWSFK